MPNWIWHKFFGKINPLFMFPKEKGLTKQEAEKRLKQFGPNILPEKPPPSPFFLLVSQLKNPLVYVLLLAGLVTIFIRHFSDAVIILVAVVINTVLGFIQEHKASNALHSLKKMITPRAEVYREGEREKIEAAALVPGDIVILFQGDKVPGDGELIYVNRLYIDEAIITGESSPVSKSVKDKVFMGTIISSGQGMMKVETTGAKTKIGKIAQKVQEIKEDTPLKKQLSIFSRQLVVLVSVLSFFVFIVGVLRGKDFIDMFTVGVALAVSSIPEGLLVSLSVVLAIGMQKILKRRGLVRKLASAETLGGVTTICIDKTGTLTQGKMQVVSHLGDERSLAKQAILANDLDDPIVISAFEWGRRIVKDYLQEHPRFDSIPFSPKERFFASLNKWDKGGNMLFVNGAPDFLLSWCDISDPEKDEIQNRIEELTSQGRRLIGFARKKVSLRKKIIKTDDVKAGLEWVGLLVFSDPVRQGVKEALVQTKLAGIRIIVITGDYPNNSEFVLNEIGIPVTKDEIVLGSEVEEMSVGELAEKVKTAKLFTRTSPDQKLKIVEALKKNGEVVAMMGDGVNDAPAIHESDIGIVVGEASDVARESADLVLLDSNFSTVVAAVEEGRAMLDNIRKIILYLMSDAFGEIIVVVGSVILGVPLPITAMQILWINLISDGFPGLALTIDPKREGLMEDKPRPPKEQLVNKWMVTLIAIVSSVSGLIALTFFLLVLKQTGDILLARSLAFITLGINSLIYVFSVRTLMNPFRWRNLVGNKWLVVAVLAGFCLQILPFLTPGLRQFFGVVLPGNIYLAIPIALSIFMLVVVESFKYIFLHPKNDSYSFPNGGI
ncbi:HAD-IC family P-type ATPase [Patescibacteria group bacterium]|nr:HAD-IC family P-type ATPase [Patescibacteria group bacterium]